MKIKLNVFMAIILIAVLVFGCIQAENSSFDLQNENQSTLNEENTDSISNTQNQTKEEKQTEPTEDNERKKEIILQLSGLGYSENECTHIYDLMDKHSLLLDDMILLINKYNNLDLIKETIEEVERNNSGKSIESQLIQAFCQLPIDSFSFTEFTGLFEQMKALKISNTTIVDLASTNKDEIYEIISELVQFADTYKVTEENTNIICKLLIEGYELHDIFHTYIIADKLGEKFDTLVKTDLINESSTDMINPGFNEKDSMSPYDILQRRLSVKETTDEEKTILTNTFNLTEEDIYTGEQYSGSLSEGVQLAALVKQYDITYEQLQEMNLFYKDLNELTCTLDAAVSLSERDQEISVDVIKDLLTDGHRLKDISRALVASKALSIDIKNIIKTNKYENKKSIKLNLEENQSEILYELEDKYSIDPMELLDYMAEEKKSLTDINQMLISYELSHKPDSINIEKSGDIEKQMSSMAGAPTVPADNEIKFDKYISAPFKLSNINNELVNTNNGDLNTSFSILNIPGRNNMNLNLSASYDSSKASLYDISYKADSINYTYKYKLTIKGLAHWYMPWLTPQLYRYITDEGADTPEQVIYFNTEQEAIWFAENFQAKPPVTYSESEVFTDTHDNEVKSTGKFNPWEMTSMTESSPAPSSKPVNTNIGYNGSIPRVEPTLLISDTGEVKGAIGTDGRQIWTRQKVYRANYSGTLTRYWYRVWITSALIEPILWDYSINYSNTTTPDTYTELHNDVGSGWEFNLSSIENLSDGSKYLHLSNGSAYKINITATAGDSNLDKYLLKDMRLETDSGSYSNGQKNSSYILYYKNGAKEYFADDGRLLAIRDRYNNTIKFEHDTSVNGHQLITKITDTLDRVTTISYQNVTNGKEITITAPGNRITKLVQEQIPGYSGDYVLKKIIDPENRETTFTYSYDTGIFNFPSKTVNGPSNVYANLREVKYPTKGLSRYTYQKAVGNLGNQGVNEYYRIQTREDIDGTISYNKNTYSYTNNYTGYGSSNDPNNLPDTFTYMTTATDAKGNTVAYTFNNKHLTMKSETRENGTTLLSKNDYTYYLDRLVATQNNTLYNKQGGSRLLQQDWSYNDFGDLLKYTDVARYVTDYQYDSTFHLVKSITKTANDSGLIMNTYNDINPSNGNINYTKQQHTVNGVNKDITTTYTYDSYGNITDETTTQSGEKTIRTHYDYDAQYKNAYPTKKTSTIKDYKGVTQNVIESYEYNINTGELLKYINGNGKATQYQYDKLGRKTIITNPDATNITVSYDDINNKVTLTDENGHQIRVNYDTLGRELSKEEIKQGVWKTLSQTKYNLLGQIDYILDGKSNKTSYQYDTFGRVIKTVFADDSYTTTDYDDAYSTTSALKMVYDEEQNRHDYIYDNLGNLIKEISYPTKGNWNEQNITQYHYNRVGKADCIIDANNHRTDYRYDDLNRLIAVTNAKGEITEYDYDILGNVKSIKDADGNITVKNYDELGRLIEQKNPLNQKENWEYDNASNMIAYIDKTNQKTTNTFNDRNWLTNTVTGTTSTSYAYGNAGELKTATDATGTVTYDYYDNGILKSKKLPDNKAITYDYDDNNNLKSLTDYFNKITDYTYDNRNRMETVTVDGKVTTYTYYENGSRKSIDNAGILRTEYFYFGDNQLRAITNMQGSNIISSYTYTYDPVGNQLSKSDESNNKTQYAYDLLNRIQKVTEQDTTQTEYYYDKSGNISWKNITHPESYTFNFNKNNTEQTMTGLTSHTVHYAYDKSNQLLLTREQILNNADEQSTYNDLFEKVTVFSYDGNGNLTKKENVGTIDPEIYSYTYNELNQLTKFTDPKNQATDYTYYADGLRSSKQTGTDKRQYYYSGDKVILETLNGNFNARTIQGINEIARQDDIGNLYYYQYNGHGDVVNLLDETGNVRNTYDFDEFGNEKVAKENGIYNPLRYTGEYYDSESGMYYLRARYYDPEIGRFVSEDTYAGNASDSLSLNRYTYCANNPIMFEDPSGNYYIVNNYNGTYTTVKDDWLKASFKNIIGIPFFKNALESAYGVVGGNSASTIGGEFKEIIIGETTEAALSRIMSYGNILAKGILFAKDSVIAASVIDMDNVAFSLFKSNSVGTTANSIESIQNLMDNTYNFIGANKDYFLESTIYNKSLYQIDLKLMSINSASAREIYINRLVGVFKENLKNSLYLGDIEGLGLNLSNYFYDYQDRLSNYNNAFTDFITN